ncbi:lectin-like [Protopterus annectens]|uniref:lectin-like n=1 Tax=Protopterus annectens TaxID=7888 RepID=UPI001CFB8185|nr:lectin-like [Protopterus annectens]
MKFAIYRLMLISVAVYAVFSWKHTHEELLNIQKLISCNLTPHFSQLRIFLELLAGGVQLSAAEVDTLETSGKSNGDRICYYINEDWARKDISSERICEGNKQYAFINELKNYTDAEFYCRRQWKNGRLVSIHNAAENEFVLHLVNSNYRNSVSYAWIGAVQLLESNQFIWTDGSTWNYTNWKSGQPDNDNSHGKEACAEMYTENDYAGKWNDNYCGHKNVFICQHF